MKFLLFQICSAILAFLVCFHGGVAAEQKPKTPSPKEEKAEMKKSGEKSERKSDGKTSKASTTETKKESKVVKTDSGLQYEILKEGTGRSPHVGALVKVHYVGTLASNGQKFDSSRDRGEAFEFQIGMDQVIKGWDEGVLTMKIGELRKLTIPPELGYGSNGVGGVVPPNATLVFEVELLGVNEL